jgi:hypothetical protein
MGMGSELSPKEPSVKPLLVCLLVLIAAAAALPALDARTPADASSPAALPTEGLKKVETDSKGDGFIDDVLYFSDKGQKVREEFDYNRDGKPDDFLYYEKGLLVREEIDTHFDGRIDVRIYLSDGAYIERYERDTNGDGVPDIVKDFSKRK